MFHGRLAGHVLDCCGGCQSREANLHLGGQRLLADAPPAADSTAHLILPPLANAHDHVRGVKPTSLGSFDLPLELWLLSMTGLPKVDPYLVAAAALGRQARGGLGSIMIHYTRPQDASRLIDELEIVARAENKDTRERGSYQAPTRDWLFDTYTQCLAVVYGQYEKT